ncbi:hypothetical protein CPAR01_13214 [Colletotrichum paranaense]|uniref:Heterokaryon incompatibility domain-containing protein n=1 Tax=Colletotrichum paranaense TaxID=1914294 RepID=A0ABQ9S5P8_9PEZI|nr:uncharacterized protein CPAR01_13214 [Colletotrichum paranaense]KAK1526686.1 hypothetical protein CPAR01_13214 [Colletotrichum paranaense]
MATNQSNVCSANIYVPLDYRSQQIRILELLPGSFDDEIECRLKTITQGASYEALSYVWGDPTHTRTIKVQGEAMNVTANLKNALQHLRRAGEALDLWVDAVCINQTDNAERKHQVGIMDIIYRGAEKVVVWLGDEERYHEDICKLIEYFGSSPDHHWRVPEAQDAKSDPFLTRATMLKLFAFLKSRDWYKRIWTVQEILLAKSVTHVCGKHVFANGEIDSMARSFKKHFSSEKCCNIDALMPSKLFSGRSLSQDMSPYLRQIALVLKTAQDQRASPGQVHFLELASTFRYRDATNPKDKIYGVLGLTNSFTKDIIDYDATVAEVYARVAINLIEKDGNLDVLSHVLPSMSQEYRGRGFYHRPPPGLPSWVPDWSDSRPGEYWRLRLLHERQKLAPCFEACGLNLTASTRICTNDLKRLILDGRLGGSIAKIGEPNEPYPPSDAGIYHAETLQQWREMANVDRKPQDPYCALLGACKARIDILDAFWRTICANLDVTLPERVHVYQADDRTRALHDRWWWNLLQRTKYKNVPVPDAHLPTSVIEQLNRFGNHNVEITGGRRFFISDTGLFGLASRDAQIGDQIWVVKGGRVPLILRPLPGPYRETHERDFTFVGDSYVHGIMEGELFEIDLPNTKVTLV